MSEKWECFCDVGYYHMWAVRPVGDRSFSSQNLFHVQSKEEAEALRGLLNRYFSAHDDLATALEWYRQADLHEIETDGGYMAKQALSKAKGE